MDRYSIEWSNFKRKVKDVGFVIEIKPKFIILKVDNLKASLIIPIANIITSKKL